MSKTNNFQVEYTLSMPQPASHFLNVKIKIYNIPVSQKTIELKMPAWRSGRYLLFDFAGGVQEFSAKDENSNVLNWVKTDKATWNINRNGNSVIAEYKVFANDFLNRTCGLNSEHAFINNLAVFMFSPNYSDKPLTLKVEPFSNWHVTTGMELYNNIPNLFYAPNYNYFADCPLEIVSQTDFSFDVNGFKHTISFFGEANYDKEKLIKDFTTIIKKNHDFWGSVPYKNYTFIVHCTPQSGGGTEHINSTVVGVKPQAFNYESGYKSFLRLISHEFFHTWNVKQLKPAGLTPYDWTKENYTRELWIAEGGTSYYDGLMLVRTGQMSIDDFYKEITRGADDERRRPGNKIQPLSESSFDAWIKFWKRSANSYNSESDYYSKGSYVCLILDLEIRQSSNNKYSLDDVFRYMYNKFPLDVKGYTNIDFRKACEKYAGKSLKQFFADYVDGVKPIEWEKYLLYAGLELTHSDSVYIPVVGLVCVKQENKIIVQDVLEGSSSEKAGLMRRDEIIAVDNNRLSYEEAEKFIGELKAGDKVNLTIFRDNILIDFKISREEVKLSNYKLKLINNLTPLQKNIYNSWLGIKN
ncbi:MAG: M61 family metallopeptidase [Ignavibacteria bacterium]|nr:M61 family metallopeptidase [Ignavibacteria bacterium]